MNENGTVHFKEWMIAILSMTKTDTLLHQGMDGFLKGYLRYKNIFCHKVVPDAQLMNFLI